jgi:hypothetical protein
MNKLCSNEYLCRRKFVELQNGPIFRCLENQLLSCFFFLQISLFYSPIRGHINALAIIFLLLHSQLLLLLCWYFVGCFENQSNTILYTELRYWNLVHTRVPEGLLTAREPKASYVASWRHFWIFFVLIFSGGLNSVNACYHADQKLLSYRLLSANMRIETYTQIRRDRTCINTNHT